MSNKTTAQIYATSPATAATPTDLVLLWQGGSQKAIQIGGLAASASAVGMVALAGALGGSAAAPTALGYPDAPALQAALNARVPVGRTVNGQALSADISLSKTDFGLGQVDNTPDTAKPVSAPQLTALNAKQVNIQFVDHGANLGTSGLVSSLNVTGSGATFSAVGNVLTLNIPGAGTATTTMKKDGTTVSSAVSTYNFGHGLSAAESPAGQGNIDLNLSAYDGSALPVTAGGTGGTTAATARGNLGLAIGTNVQAFSTDLQAISALTPTNDDVVQRKGGAWTNRTLAQLMTDLLGVAPTVVVDATTARTLAASDNGKVLRFTSASAVSVTVPTAFSNYGCRIVRAGTGTVTLLTSGTTINANSLASAGLVLDGQYTDANLIPTGVANTFDLIGKVGDHTKDIENVAAALLTNGVNTNISFVYDSANHRLNATVTGAGGDASTNTAVAVDSEMTLFNGTSGKSLKRATGSGIPLLTSGVVSVIAGSNDDIVQRKAGAYTNRTMAQLSVDLLLIPPTVTVEATTARTLAPADNETIIRCTSSSAVTITVPTSFSGCTVTIVRAGTGTVTLAASGTTLNGGSLVLNGQYLSVTLLPTGVSNTFDVLGATGDLDGAEATLATAATTDLSTVTSRNVSLTGNATVTSFGTMGAGAVRRCRTTGTPTITNNANIVCPNNGSNISCAVGDAFTLVSQGGGVWVMTQFQRASGAALNNAGAGTVTNTAGALTSNALVLGAGSVDTKVAAGITSDGTSLLTLGVAGTSVGGVDLKNATSGTLSLRPPTGALGTVTITVPARTDTLATLAGTETLTNKTLTSPTSTGATMTGVTTLALRNAGTGVFDMTVRHNGTLTAARTLDFDLGDATRKWTFGGDFITAGGTITLTATATTNVTLPTTGTLATNDQVQAFTKAQRVTPVTLTDGATVTPDSSASNNFRWVIGGNRTLANPTNLADGRPINIYIKQDATGSRIITYGSKFKFPASYAAGDKTLSTGANAVDLLACYYDSTDDIVFCTLAKGAT